MAFDKVIDSAVLDADLTAVADAIRAKGGTTEQLSFPDGFVSAVEGIQTGGSGGIEPTATYLSLGEASKTMAAYPFVPKYKHELIVWNTKGTNKAGSGGVTPYAVFAWIINGSPSSEYGWISGAGTTTPWEDSAYALGRRTASFSLNESGQFTVPTGTWAFWGTNNTVELYEIPLPIGLGV